MEDDGNPAWIDIDYESDDNAAFEARWRADEDKNNENLKVINVNQKELKEWGKTTLEQSQNVSPYLFKL